MNTTPQLPADSPLVDVVMVTYGRSDLVRRSLSALFASSPAGAARVTIVDNNSPDDTPDVVAAEFPQVRLLRRNDNAGFSVSNNQALALATAPYVLLLNPDTELHWPTLEHLIRELEQNPTIGMIGCRLLLDDGSLDHAAKRRIPSPLEALQYFTFRIFGLKVGRYVAKEIPETGVGDVDALNGAFMLVTSAALRSVGGLDESYWMYMEDLDWCVRFREAGWRVVYDGRVTAVHVKSASSGPRRSLKLNRAFHRSMAIFYRQHVAPSNPAVLNVLVVLAIWIRFGLVQATTVAINASAKIRPRTSSH